MPLTIAMLSSVLRQLVLTGWKAEAWRVVWTHKGWWDCHQDAIRRGRKSALHALMTTGADVTRAALARWALTEERPVLKTISVLWTPTLEEAAERYAAEYVTKGWKGGRGPLTFQHACLKEKKICRRFVTARNAEAALAFFLKWYEHDKGTMLLECGAYDATWRKWVMDVDASDDLSATLEEVVEMSRGIAMALHEGGYLPYPCPFAITSRHTETKRSWHVTLCGLACHERWRAAMQWVRDHRSTAWPLFRFVDPTTLNNSKSQYMQVLGSTKVKAGGGKKDGVPFTFEGLWRGPEMRKDDTVQSLPLQYAVTSLMMHDPWSIPFLGVGRTLHRRAGTVLDDRDFTALLQRQTPKKKKTNSGGGAKKGGEKEEVVGGWEKVAPWITELLVEKRGNTATNNKLAFIPAMKLERNLPPSFSSDVDGILMHAYACDLAFCPRLLLTEGAMRRHTNNAKSVVLVTAQKKQRLFVHCLSDKCKKKGGERWVELTEAGHLAMVRRKREQTMRPLPSSSEMAPWPPASPPWMQALVTQLWQQDGVEDGSPKKTKHRFLAQMEWCPRFLAQKKRQYIPSHASQVELALVLEESPRTAARTCFRLFARCPSFECVHLGDGWDELLEMEAPALFIAGRSRHL